MASTWYTCARKMAVGGMAELLLASQQGLAGFEKLVVIKQILPRLREDKRFVQMFLDEARLAARLRHPCIAEIYDVHRDGESYSVVMEYLSGEDLGYVLRSIAQAESRVPIPFACRIIADVADGLHAAHSATDVDGTSHGIIHRDVSPSNIVVTYDGVTKLVDFGVAKANENHIYTRPGTIRGKLPYMSPEQVQARDLDGRSDLFSLGAVLHEMLTSRRLFSGPSESAILKNVMERRIPPPSVYNPRVPPALDEIVLALLERDPDRRISTAASLRDQLEKLVQHDGVTQRRVGEWMRTALAPRYSRRRAIERQIVEQARVASGPTPTGAELPPLFGDDEGPGAAPREQLAAAFVDVPTGVGLPVGGSSTYSSLSASGSMTPSREIHVAPATSGRTGSVPAYVRETRERHAPAPTLPPPVVVTSPPPPPARNALWVAFGAALGVIALGAGAAVVVLRRPELLDGGSAPRAASLPAPAPTPAPVLAPAPPPPETDSVGMLVHVVPEASRLEIDGKPVEQPVGSDGFLVAVPRAADVHVRISKEGYVSHEVTLHTPTAGTMPIYVTLAREDATAEAPAIEIKTGAALVAAIDAAGPRGVDAGRARNAAQLQVAFEPDGAQVVIDGKRARGDSPYRTVLGAGSHTVSVTAEGYEPVSKTFDLAPGVTYEMAVHLSRAAIAMGRVDFRSTPMGAVVSVNGELKGRTPIVGLELPLGRTYSVIVQQQGYEPYSTEIEPTSDRALTVDATMVSLPVNVAAPPVAAAAPAKAQAAPEPALDPVPAPAAPSPSPTKRGAPRVVPPAAVTKVSGSLPHIEARRLPQASGISVKLCIDERGRVSSAQVGGKLPEDVHRQLERAFTDWRYQPYVERGNAMPVCFAVVFSLKSSTD